MKVVYCGYVRALLARRFGWSYRSAGCVEQRVSGSVCRAACVGHTFSACMFSVVWWPLPVCLPVLRIVFVVSLILLCCCWWFPFGLLLTLKQCRSYHVLCTAFGL